MDAPPPQEDVRPFVHVAGLIGAAGLHGPAVLECDAAQGFLLLTDLGGRLYLTRCARPTRPPPTH
jgi:N-acetylmuramate 1-kinase